MATSFRTVILFAIWCCSALIAQDLKSFKEIANRWHPEVKITQHVEDGPYGYVEAAEVRTNNDGAKWCFEPVPGTNYVRIENDI